MEDLLKKLQDKEKSPHTDKKYLFQCKKAHDLFEDLMSDREYQEAYSVLETLPGLVDFSNPLTVGFFYERFLDNLGEIKAKQYRKLITYEFQRALKEIWDDEFNESWIDMLREHRRQKDAD